MAFFSGGKAQTGETTYEGKDAAYVQLQPSPDDAVKLGAMGVNFKVEMGLVREDGKWKIDLAQTITRLVAQARKQMMKSGGATGFPGMRGMGAPHFGPHSSGMPSGTR